MRFGLAVQRDEYSRDAQYQETLKSRMHGRNSTSSRRATTMNLTEHPMLCFWMLSKKSATMISTKLSLVRIIVLGAI